MQDLLAYQRIEVFEDPGLGIIDSPMTPDKPSKVRFLGSIWPAQFICDSGKPMRPGDRVVVVGRAGITLLVMPESECHQCPRQDRKCGRQCLVRIYALSKKNILRESNRFLASQPLWE